ncbi:DUF4314 domain-containing protein [Lactococcus lactis]
MLPSEENIKRLKSNYPEGTRVKLLKMTDNYAPPLGCFGTVVDVDDWGTIFVHWDNGSGLGLVYGEDACLPVTPEEESEAFEERLQGFVGQVVFNHVSALEALLNAYEQESEVTPLGNFIFEAAISNQKKLIIETEPMEDTERKIKIIRVHMK